MYRRTLGIVAAASLAAALPLAPTARAHDGHEATNLIFNGEGNRLNVLDPASGEWRTLIFADADADAGQTPDGTPVPADALVRDINAQICFTDVDEAAGTATFIAGEDTKQGDQSGDDLGQAGWGVFDIAFDADDPLDTMTAEQVGKLVPEFKGTDANKNENYGCGFLDNGNLLLSDVGNQRPGEAGTGQLHIWFRDDEGFTGGYDFATDAHLAASDNQHCFVDTGIPTAGGIEVAVDPVTKEEVVLVASARTGVRGEPWGIFKYTGLGDLAAGDCAPDDGQTLVQQGKVTKTPFIVDAVNVPTPNAVVASGHSTYYVSSVFNGVIAEYSAVGTFIRRVLTPVEPLPPYASTGTPLGLDVDSAGNLWFADIGVGGVEDAARSSLDAVLAGDPAAVAGAFGHIGPQERAGSVRSIGFLAHPVLGVSQPPTTHIADRAFPDGIGILTLGLD